MLELTGIAASSGALGGLAGNPADIVLVRMVSDPTKPPEKQVHYRNALHGVYKMVQVEGFGSLFRGLLPNTVSARCWEDVCQQGRDRGSATLHTTANGSCAATSHTRASSASVTLSLADPRSVAFS